MPLLTQSALLTALGWSLFNSFWQMGLLWLFYWIVISILRNLSSHSRHNLATVLLAAGAIWSGAGFVSAYFFHDPSGYRITGPGSVFSLLSINQILPWCSSLYLVVLGILLIRYSNHYFHSKRLRYSGLSKMRPELRVFVESTGLRMGIRRPVQVWLSSLADVPLTLGFLKPVILLPVAMANNLTLEQSETILLHELAHIRCNDYLLNLGVIVLELLFFFNPFSRFLIRELKKEREHRCDDWVMQFRYDPHTYVSALLSLATHEGRHRQRLTMAATGGGSDRLLLQRVRRVLRQKTVNDRPGTRPIILLLFTLTVTLFALSRPGIAISPRSRIAGTIPRSSSIEGPVSTRAIVNTAVTATAPGQPTVLRLTVRKPRPATATPPDDQPATDEEDNNNNPVLLTEGDATGPVAENLAAIAQPESREFSINNGPANNSSGTRPDPKLHVDGLPFVPHSSFSFQYMEDSTRPEEQLVYLQQYNEQQVATLLKKMQEDIAAAQLQNLNLNKTRQTRQATLKAQQRLLDQQLKIQQQYLQKLDALQKKLEKTSGRRLRIVYI